LNIDFGNGQWLNSPKSFEIADGSLKVVTEPGTDLWQRSYYGFRNDNAPAFLFESGENFTFTAHASYAYQTRYDQCGLLVYIDSDYWFKASVEYEDEHLSRLGSVVTNDGYSDWATTDIPTPTSMWYRLSRRGPDFLIESSADGVAFAQMRIFHLHCLGETTEDMGQLDPPAPAEQAVRFGLYACSPLDSSFEARFDCLTLEGCRWRAHGTD
jgi:regulation of enolase protein 1 (concanavalin A-like superfamily)